MEKEENIEERVFQIIEQDKNKNSFENIDLLSNKLNAIQFDEIKNKFCFIGKSIVISNAIEGKRKKGMKINRTGLNKRPQKIQKCD